MDFEQASSSLIDIIRNYELLYNTEHMCYKDPDLKREAWEEVAYKLSENLGKDVSVTEVKSRWSNLRDRYKRLQKMGKEITWQHYDSLYFLDPHHVGRVIKHRPPPAKHSARQQAKKEKEAQEAKARAIEDAQARAQAAQTPQNGLADLSTPTSPQNGDHSHMQEPKPSPMDTSNSCFPSTDSDSYFFCMDLCKTLDGMPPEARRLKKMQLFQAMYSD